MKRRNFLSGLLASPVALKTRFLARKRCAEICGAPILGLVHRYQPARYQILTARQREVVELLAGGKSMKEAADVLKVAPLTVTLQAHCSLPRGHRGPHVLLNPR